MKDSPIFLYIHIILLINSPSNLPIYQRDSPIFYTYKSRGVLKIILGCYIPLYNPHYPYVGSLASIISMPTHIPTIMCINFSKIINHDINFIIINITKIWLIQDSLYPLLQPCINMHWLFPATLDKPSVISEITSIQYFSYYNLNVL